MPDFKISEIVAKRIMVVRLIPAAEAMSGLDPVSTMRIAATVLTPLVALLFLVGCLRATPRPAPPAAAHVLAEDALLPSPRLIVGRIVAVDPGRAFAFVELAGDAPPNAVGAGSELMSRTMDLKETARLLASRQLRGRTLGTKILSGQPSPGDEVVWLAP